jgi:hypothetical protein
MATCPNCGNQAGEGAVFCDRCGTRLPTPEVAAPAPAPAPTGGSVICPACGAGNVPGEVFCDFCGLPLPAPLPSAEPAPELEAVSAEAQLEAAPQISAVEAEQAPPAPTPEEMAPPAEGEPTCPACGEKVQPDEAFCASCGASLAQAPIPPEPVAEVEPEPAVDGVPLAPVVEEAGPPPPAEPAPAEVLRCPVCGAEAEAGDAFCSSCGAALKVAPAPAPAPVEEAPAPPPLPVAPAGPRLVVVASGAEIPLPGGPEIVIGREDPVSGIYPEVDLTPHGGEDGGVSRRHSRLIVESGSYFIEDLDSTNFTFLNKQKLAPKTRHALTDGDEIRCGRVALILKLS